MRQQYLPVSLVLTVFLATLAVACSSGGSSSTTPSAAPSTPKPTPVDVPALIAKEAPGYAGFFADTNTSILYIYSSDPNIDVARVRQALRDHGLARPSWGWDSAVVLPENNTMLFSSWLWVVGPIVSDAASVTFYGVDTKHDKIIFGVEASEDIEKAKQAIHKAHFPLGQFTFQVTGPIEVDSGA